MRQYWQLIPFVNCLRLLVLIKANWTEISQRNQENKYTPF